VEFVIARSDPRRHGLLRGLVDADLDIDSEVGDRRGHRIAGET
jgi:hypothetical protein